MALDFNRVTLSGTVVGGETWSTSCAYQTNFGTGPVKDYADLLAWATAVAAFSGNDYVTLQTGLSEVNDLNAVRIEYIDSAGVVAQVAEAAMDTAWSPASAPKMPFQCSVVLSLLTGRPGRSYRGRMYWPALAMSLEATSGQLAAATTAAIAADAAQLLTDIGTAAGVDFLMVPSVSSAKLGTSSVVTQVSVGSVIDTQRRRRNQLRESRSASPVPAA